MDDKGKAPIVQKDRNHTTLCFRCNQTGHFATQCPSRALHIGRPELEEPETKESCDEEVYEAGTELIDEYVEEEEIIGMDQLGVVRCILTQVKKNEDWRRTNILQTFIRIGDKVCKVIIDSGSCVNAISTNVVKSLNLPTVSHPNPYKVSWIDATSIPIRF